MENLELISLGYNCEISFRIKDFLGELSSYPFSWSEETDRKLFVKCIKNNLDGLLSEEITVLPSNMFQCEKYKISFHPREDKLKVNGSITDDSIAWCKKELVDRVNHLKEKFISLQQSEKNVVFFIKVNVTKFDDDVKYVLELYEALKDKFVIFKLVVVVDNKELKSRLNQVQCQNLYVRKLKKFSKQRKIENSGDIKGWYEIMTEFTGMKSNIFYSNFRKRKIERLKLTLKKKLHIK